MTAANTIRTQLDRFEADTPADEALMAQVLATLDLIDRLDADIDANGVTLTGARGQPVANPSVSAVGKQRIVLAQLLSRLFPGDEPRGARAARRAANARWGNRR